MIPDTARHIAFFVYPGFVLLDLSGPLEAFATAAELLPGSYRLTIMSLDGGEVVSSCGLPVVTGIARQQAIDTFVIAGDLGLPDRQAPPRKMDFIRAASRSARRTASVCMGSFLFAESGVLDGRRATTHWLFAPRMQEMYPSIRVEADRIFLNDNGVWTSAGMTAGIDMALAMIEEDLGGEVARKVARMMVVYYRRPAGQMQFSSLLDLDPGSDRIRRVLSFAREHLHQDLSVEHLADVAHLSLRQFSRAFVASTGMTPAKAVERLRVETARPLVEESRQTLETIADVVGFADAERMRQSFIRVVGQSPRVLRRLARARVAEMA